MVSLPLGLLRRHREGGVDLIEIEFDRYRRAAFRILAGVAPRDGLMTFTGHCAVEDVFVGWLNEYFAMYAYPRLWAWPCLWGWFSARHLESDCEKLALRVAGLVPELEFALREGRVGPHMRRVVINHPAHVVREGKI